MVCFHLNYVRHGDSLGFLLTHSMHKDILVIYFHTGISGGGKSTIAGKLLQKWSAKHQGEGISGTIKGTEEETLERHIIELARRERVEVDYVNTRELLTVFVKKLREKTEKPTFIILDDLEGSFDHVFGSLLDLACTHSLDRFRVVITMQNGQEVTKYDDEFELLEVTGFSQSEATRYLSQIPQDRISDVLAVVSHLPLALAALKGDLKSNCVSANC